MAKKKDGSGVIIVLGIIGFAMFQTWEWAKQNIEIVSLIMFLLILFFVIKFLNNRKKHKQWIAYLAEKYQDDEVVEKILDGYFWEGQTDEMLEDSLGEPDIIDKKVMKTKVKEVWKYGKKQANQYRLTITLENNIVVGWNKKGG